ncbi:hypothetical protein GCM10009717_07240 [Agromyces allii]|uniref:Methyltransferase domain-containing protein n=1 Tax=Agromyces allii TaxID=393607 RepID=A0ABN2Q4B9_9MICO
MRVTRSELSWSPTIVEGSATRSGPEPVAIDIEIDGRRLWSSYLPPIESGRHRLEWPSAVRPHLGGTGELTIRSATDRVRLVEGPYRLGRASSGRTIADLVAAGTVVDKWGTLVAGSSRALHELLLDATELVISQLDGLGYNVSITGGTLLGAVRSGAILERDDDVDLLVYLGEASPTEVSLASYRLEREMAAAGHHVVRHSDAHLQLEIGGATNEQPPHVDLFLGFFHGGAYNQPIHVRAPLAVDQLQPLADLEIGGRMLPAVADPEAWLAACYGPTWATPDPAFRFETPPPTRRRFENWFGVLDFTRLFWEQRYAGSGGRSARAGREAGRMIAASAPGDRILDLGCGSGAAAAKLARAGRSVLAVDFARTALRAASARSAGAFEVRRVNLADSHAVLELIEQEAGAERPVHVLLGDVLAYLPRDARANTFRLLRAVLGRDGVAVVSFPDTLSPRYEHERPDTWHLPLDWFVEEIRPFGLEFEVERKALRRTSAGLRRSVHLIIRNGAPSARQEEPAMSDPTNENESVESNADAGAGRVAELEAEVAALRGEIDELRRDSRRIAELYDLVVDRLGRSGRSE